MLSYWGKARNSDASGPPYHLLAYHSLDVAAVVAEWWEQSPVLRSQCCYTTGLEEAQTYAWVVFFIALHDYGKWDIRFQLKAPPAGGHAWHHGHPHSRKRLSATRWRPRLSWVVHARPARGGRVASHPQGTPQLDSS